MNTPPGTKVIAYSCDSNGKELKEFAEYGTISSIQGKKVYLKFLTENTNPVSIEKVFKFQMKFPV